MTYTHTYLYMRVCVAFGIITWSWRTLWEVFQWSVAVRMLLVWIFLILFCSQICTKWGLVETANLCSCGSIWGGSWARSEGWLLTHTAVGRKANLLVKGSPGLLSHLWLLPRGLSMWSLRHFLCWLKAPRVCVPRRRPDRHYCDFCHPASEVTQDHFYCFLFFRNRSLRLTQVQGVGN